MELIILMRKNLQNSFAMCYEADVRRTGETPWVKRIIEQYHETAKSNGAIVRSILLQTKKFSDRFTDQ